MRQILSDIDRLLRGGFTQPADLKVGKISIPIRNLLIAGVALGCTYGVFMGIYGATRPNNATYLQLLATAIKVPLLFLLTLMVCFPSLYVMSALAGSRLMFKATLRLLLAAVAINLALLTSFGPVVGFFTLSTQSYPFMVVLNVMFFGIAGVVGLLFLRKALNHVFSDPPVQPAGMPSTPADDAPPQPPPNPMGHHRKSDPGLILFRAWLVVYGVVGCQMGWVLRPFVGSPSLEFELFRTRESNFFQGLLNAIQQLFS